MILFLFTLHKMDQNKTKNSNPIEYTRWRGTQGSKFLLLPSHASGHTQEDTKRAKQWILNNFSNVDSIMVEWQSSGVVGYNENNVYIRTQNEKGNLSGKQIKTWVEVTTEGIRIVIDNQNKKSGPEIMIHSEKQIFKVTPQQLIKAMENL